MKILMYGWEFPPHISGGLGVACYGIAKGILNNNATLSLILPNTQYINITSSQIDKLDMQPSHAFSPINILSPYLINSEFHNDDQNYRLLQEVIAYANKVSWYAKNVNHDIIYAHDWLTSLAGIGAKKRSGKPLLLHFHSIESDRSGEHRNQTIYHIEKLALNEADKIIAVSHYTKNQICQNYGIKEDKVSVVHNGIFPKQIKPESSFIPAANKNYILFIGRLTYQKGAFYFIEAAEKLLKIRDDVEFVIAGNGDQRPWLMKYIAKKRLTNRIHFTGFLDHNALSRLFLLAKAYVMPSITEPFGLSCLEALANQVPVIISKHSGVREVLPRLLSFDFWDTNELANKMNAVLHYPQLTKVELNYANDVLPTLTWDHAGKKILEICNKMIGEKN